MRHRPRHSRHREVQRVRGRLETISFPRLHMLALVALTGMAGFMASALLLSGGMSTMWSRYLAAFGIAYVAFLCLLWLWLRTRTEDWSDFPDLSTTLPDLPQPHGQAHGIVVHHGDFGGGCASASLDSTSLDSTSLDSTSLDAPRNAAPPKAVGKALSAARQAQEMAIPLTFVVFFATLVLSSLFLLWSAPTLFAELLVDGVLSASLYRRLRGLQTQHWIATAIRRTAWPFALAALLVAGLGWGMAQYAPGAHSIGEAVAYANGRL